MNETGSEEFGKINEQIKKTFNNVQIIKSSKE